MQAEHNVSLKRFNTFGLAVSASLFMEVNNEAELLEALKSNQGSHKLLVLGGGSNMLFTNDYDGLVIKNNLQGINAVKETDDFVFVKAGGGVTWHQLVLWSVERNLGGIENLSLIPGSVGAAPIQNIGAYGVEIKDTFHELDSLHIASGAKRIFNLADCRFGYRNSIFKNEEKGNYVITSVTFQLKKNPVFNTSYGAIEQELKKMNVHEVTVKAISDAVISIRKSKLPDPAVLGNAGSFFKNPEISAEEFVSIKKQFPDIVHYPAPGGKIKIAAGWLIEQCGWKGRKVGNTGSHKEQALVLVNYGGATGNEIYQLALDISASVKEKFGVTISPEVNIIS